MRTATPKPQRKGAAPGKRRTPARKWSAEVTQHSDALSLAPDVFTLSNPREIAVSLKESADASPRRKGTPFQSAMSMLNFYINRAGRNLPKERKNVLARAKDELRQVYGKLANVPQSAIK